MTRTARLLLAALIALPAVAAAQTPPPPQEIVFVDGERVPGQPAVPLGQVIDVPPSSVRHSLIKIRTQFLDELAASARDL